MSRLPETELPQNALTPKISTVKSPVDKKTTVPEIYLTNPLANRIFESWYAQQSNPESADSLLQKLSQLSLNPPSLLAALLFLCYQQAEDLPKNLDSTDGLAAAVCHFFNSGKKNQTNTYSSWGSFVKNNPDRLK